jgi:16S rRNA A1518/A1519 N6-dimethyltransferase RsmA/KsgA/DIM1 with predicted DNA glycosylase/AP lyase activity
MQGRAFLDIARELFAGGTEAHRRATVIHAYYVLFLECRDALTRWSIAFSPRPNVHSAVRLRFLYAADADLKSIGRALDPWCRHRNDASYNLARLQKFATDTLAQHALAEVTTALALLDALESDPVRRAAAIASFPP